MAFDAISYINEPRWQESRLGLQRITELLERMGRPQDSLKFVHVAGTNGKGSVCAYLASILQAAGLKTGLFTSPYILQFEERIRVDGCNISRQELNDVTLFVREHAEAMAAETGEHPTEFELMTAVAFQHFASKKCDIVVCEVGLGGRLDSTNVIESPEACVITRIGLDHTDFLGTTYAQVATEKAGIIKQNAPVVSWPQDDPEAMRVIEDAARACKTSVIVPDFSQLSVEPIDGAVLRRFTYRGTRFTTRLLGSYQPANAVLAIEAAALLGRRGWPVDLDVIRFAIKQTTWPGRFEVVSAGPPALVVDGGHNPQGAEVLAESLRDAFPDAPVVFVMSVLADKDYRAMIRQVAPLAASFVCVTPPNPRALAAQDLASAIREELDALQESAPVRDVPVDVAADFSQALKKARAWAGPQHVICAFGSLYSIADLESAL